MIEISSANNFIIKNVTKLHLSKSRKLDKKFIIEGHKFILTALEAGLKINQLFATQEQLDKNKQLLSLVSENIIFLVSEKVMTKISSSVTPCGILAIFDQPIFKDLTNGIGLVLDNIMDPGNMGTLIRTAVACNVKNIIVIDGADVWSPKVVQSSAGNISLINIFNWSYDELIANKRNHQLIGLLPNASESIFNLPQSTNNALLIVGNESNGISEKLLSKCERLVKLPMPGKTESLNAAVAGSIALYYFISPKF